jgi:hypothetical protein
MSKDKLTYVTFLLLAVAAIYAQAQQKVEDPGTKKKVQAAVEQYIKQDTQLKGGYFLRDLRDNTVRDLTFDHVHQGVEQTPAGEYVVCVDLLDQSKNRLDVDFWLKPAGAGDLAVSKIRIHKVNGVERKSDPSPGISKDQ